MHPDPLFEVLSSDGNATLILSPQLEIQQCPPPVEALFETFFPNSQENGTRLPFPMHCWIIDRLQREQSSRTHRPVKVATTFSRHGRILIVLLYQLPNDPQPRLFLQEDPAAKATYDSVREQLTRRQLEMYHLIKDGERDIRTIARKMGISVRTAEGHKMNLQRILPRL